MGENWRYTMSAAFGGAGLTVGDLSALARAKYRKDKDVDTSQVGWYRRSQNLKISAKPKKEEPKPAAGGAAGGAATGAPAAATEVPVQPFDELAEYAASFHREAADQIARERATWAAVVNAERDLLDKSHMYQQEYAAYYNRTPLKNAADETELRRYTTHSTSGGAYPYNTNTNPCTHNRREAFGLDVRTLQPCSTFEHRYGQRTDIDPNSMRVDFGKFSKRLGGGAHRT